MKAITIAVAVLLTSCASIADPGITRAHAPPKPPVVVETADVAPPRPNQFEQPVITVGGIPLGVSFSMPECPKMSSGEKTPCYGRLHYEGNHAPPVNEEVDVVLPIDQLPAIVGEYVVIVIGGRAEGLRIRTLGIQYQSSDLAALVTKFGTPTSMKESKVKTMAGAEFDVIDAGWVGKGYMVTFTGANIKITEGSVQVLTSAGYDYMQRKAAERGDRRL